MSGGPVWILLCHDGPLLKPLPVLLAPYPASSSSVRRTGHGAGSSLVCVGKQTAFRPSSLRVSMPGCGVTEGPARCHPQGPQTHVHIRTQRVTVAVY